LKHSTIEGNAIVMLCLSDAFSIKLYKDLHVFIENMFSCGNPKTS